MFGGIWTSSRVLKKSLAWARNREHNGIQGSPERKSNCGGSEFFNGLLVVKTKRKSPEHPPQFQGVFRLAEGSKRLILSTRRLVFGE